MAKTSKKKKVLSTKSKLRRAKWLGRAGGVGGAVAGTAVGGFPLGTAIGGVAGGYAGLGAAKRRYKFSKKEVSSYQAKRKKNKAKRQEQTQHYRALRIQK